MNTPLAHGIYGFFADLREVHHATPQRSTEESLIFAVVHCIACATPSFAVN